VRVDAGNVSLRDLTYMLAIQTKGSKDKCFVPEHEGAVCVGRLSKAIFDCWATPILKL